MERARIRVANLERGKTTYGLELGIVLQSAIIIAVLFNEEISDGAMQSIDALGTNPRAQ